MRLLAGGCAVKRSPPHPQRGVHLLSRRLQFGNLCVDGVEHSFSGGTHCLTRFPTAVADAQEGGNLGQREAEPLRIPHERQSTHDTLRIFSVAGGRSGGLWQQA
jgi:hypothetical protein